MTDARNGCPERALIPPENTDPPEWLDEDDFYYQAFKDRRFEDELV